MQSTASDAAPAASAPLTKGSTVRSTLEFLRHHGGAERVAQVMERLAPDRRQRVEHAAAHPTAEVPFDLLAALLHAADGVLGGEDPGWVERAGAFAIESSGMQLYAGILRKASPSEFLTQPVSLFRLYYQPGDMEVVENGAGRVVLRLVGFDHREPLFCRRQTGGLLCALELAGGRDPSVRHVRCAEDGDAFCEWELTWSPE